MVNIGFTSTQKTQSSKIRNDLSISPIFFDDKKTEKTTIRKRSNISELLKNGSSNRANVTKPKNISIVHSKPLSKPSGRQRKKTNLPGILKAGSPSFADNKTGKIKTHRKKSNLPELLNETSYNRPKTPEKPSTETSGRKSDSVGNGIYSKFNHLFQNNTFCSQTVTLNVLVRELAALKKSSNLQNDLLEKIYGSEASSKYRKDFPIVTNDQLLAVDKRISEEKEYRLGLVVIQPKCFGNNF